VSEQRAKWNGIRVAISVVDAPKPRDRDNLLRVLLDLVDARRRSGRG
jgi:hypothetical protein